MIKSNNEFKNCTGPAYAYFKSHRFELTDNILGLLFTRIGVLIYVSPILSSRLTRHDKKIIIVMRFIIFRGNYEIIYKE